MENKNWKELIDELQIIRYEKGLSLSQCAKSMVVSRESVSNIFMKRNAPTIRTLTKLCDVLGTDIVFQLKNK